MFPSNSEIVFRFRPTTAVAQPGSEPSRGPNQGMCNDNKHCNKNEMYFSFRKGMMFTSPVMSALILTLALLPGNMM